MKSLSSWTPSLCQGPAHRGQPCDRYLVGTEQQEARHMGPQVSELDEPGDLFRDNTQLGPCEIWWCLRQGRGLGSA